MPPSTHIAEADWKRLRKLKEVALDRVCASILRECQDIAVAEGQSTRERDLKLFRHIRERDDDVADAFNGLSRSTAVRRLVAMGALDWSLTRNSRSFLWKPSRASAPVSISCTGVRGPAPNRFHARLLRLLSFRMCTPILVALPNSSRTIGATNDAPPLRTRSSCTLWLCVSAKESA